MDLLGNIVKSRVVTCLHQMISGTPVESVLRRHTFTHFPIPRVRKFSPFLTM